ncbi:MAG: hypothetical protein Q9219_004156 [cf. Caloplaca sp. 3 TL-2023]
MLPSAKNYLIRGGLSPQAAAYATIGCFLGGVISIQAVSRVMHHFIPSHVVDCEHSHDDPSSSLERQGLGAHDHQNGHISQSKGHVDEHSPLLHQGNQHARAIGVNRPRSATGEMVQKPGPRDPPKPLSRRPSLQTRVSKLISGAKSDCRGDGRCYGYSDPCAQECFKAASRNTVRSNDHPHPFGASHPNLPRTMTAPYSYATQPPLTGLSEEDYFTYTDAARAHTLNKVSDTDTTNGQTPMQDTHKITSQHTPDIEYNASSPSADDSRPQHHHHVPTNAFLSIGLQTSIAIALHKLPEGFITFATNHANPHLGFTVFMALFIHNISEGFAMALPLYLAIRSRWKSMFWSSLLGGASQPLGAGLAALWFKVAGTSDRAPGERVYGCMFAITAGIMASVALQLFAESLALSHSRNICLTFAFLGMGILGVSFALTAG